MAQAATDKEHLAAMAYRRYQRALKTAGAVDFDDLLLCTEELFEHFPAARRDEAARFRHLLIDEYQDTNGSQYRIVKALADEHRNLCVVGDDDQSIYGWRGAEVTHILRFKRDWPDATVIRLEENYRSTAAILALANRLIAYNTQRHDKVLRAFRPAGEEPRILQFPDETVEAPRVIEEIRAPDRTPKPVEPRDVAILFRTNEQPRAFETELRRAKLPYTLIGGMSFYDRKEVRDVLAYLKVIVQPARRSLAAADHQHAAARHRGEGRRAFAGAGRGGRQAAVGHSARRGADSRVAGGGGHGGRPILRTDRGYREIVSHGRLVLAVRQLLPEVGYQDEIASQYKDPNEQEAIAGTPSRKS